MFTSSSLHGFRFSQCLRFYKRNFREDLPEGLGMWLISGSPLYTLTESTYFILFRQDDTELNSKDFLNHEGGYVAE